jgi:hypothetical protein
MNAPNRLLLISRWVSDFLVRPHYPVLELLIDFAVPVNDNVSRLDHLHKCALHSVRHRAA